MTDIAYLPTAADGDYLAMVIDLFSHKVAGRSLSTPLATGLVCEALRRAVEPRRPQGRRLRHHSDRGWQYASEVDPQTLRRLGLDCSMSRTDCGYDSAARERFYWSVQHEWTNRTTYTHREDARRGVFQDLETFDNPVRLHQTLSDRSPHQFKAEHGSTPAE